MRDKEGDFILLGPNGRILVQGGVGTGKTFLALKQAEWLAEGEDGRSVLFVVYNLLLAERLKRKTSRLKLKRGSVTVLSWEELPEYVVMALDSGNLDLNASTGGILSFIRVAFRGKSPFKLRALRILPLLTHS